MILLHPHIKYVTKSCLFSHLYFSRTSLLALSCLPLLHQVLQMNSPNCKLHRIITTLETLKIKPKSLNVVYQSLCDLSPAAPSFSSLIIPLSTPCRSIFRFFNMSWSFSTHFFALLIPSQVHLSHYPLPGQFRLTFQSSAEITGPPGSPLWPLKSELSAPSWAPSDLGIIKFYLLC